jgi:hypothetical protein
MQTGPGAGRVGRRRVTEPSALFRRPPSEPDVNLSIDPALQYAMPRAVGLADYPDG